MKYKEFELILIEETGAITAYQFPQNKKNEIINLFKNEKNLVDERSMTVWI